MCVCVEWSGQTFCGRPASLSYELSKATYYKSKEFSLDSSASVYLFFRGTRGLYRIVQQAACLSRAAVAQP